MISTFLKGFYPLALMTLSSAYAAHLGGGPSHADLGAEAPTSAPAPTPTEALLEGCSRLEGPWRSRAQLDRDLGMGKLTDLEFWQLCYAHGYIGSLDFLKTCMRLGLLEKSDYESYRRAHPPALAVRTEES